MEWRIAQWWLIINLFWISSSWLLQGILLLEVRGSNFWNPVLIEDSVFTSFMDSEASYVYESNWSKTNWIRFRFLPGQTTFFLCGNSNESFCTMTGRVPSQALLIPILWRTSPTWSPKEAWLCLGGAFSLYVLTSFSPIKRGKWSLEHEFLLVLSLVLKIMQDWRSENLEWRWILLWQNQ